MFSNDPVTETSPSAETSNAPQPFAERFSDNLQHLIQVVIGSNRKPPRRFRSFLNGTWIGHPLHPAITDVPVGAWVIAAIFDIIWLVSPTSLAWAAHGAEVAVALGILGALGAAVTGLADWSDTYGSERRVGLNHTAWETGSEDYEAVLPLESVEENKLYRVTVADVPVVLIRQGLQFYAISATCSHAGGPLDEGTLEGDVVQCPWHGSRFCMRDGRVLTGPATAKAPRYDVRVRSGQVEVKSVGEH
jgi:nitrite reductase/ring-hydroxylating ferredoxin subunit